MIYDYIEKTVSDILKNQFSFTDNQILSKNEIPDDEVSFFSRQVWTYGSLSEMGNNTNQVSDILTMEVYERKNDSENNIELFVREIRTKLMDELSLVKYRGRVAKLREITIDENTNDIEWDSFTVSLTFQVINARV